jgi:hypothetical protein
MSPEALAAEPESSCGARGATAAEPERRQPLGSRGESCLAQEAAGDEPATAAEPERRLLLSP